MDEVQGRRKLLARRATSIVLLAVALVLLFMALPLPGRARAGTGSDIRRVVVITLDTTRMDDFSCYDGIPKTPNIDAVAARGMRYRNSIAPLPKTSPSVASFMTGRLPNRHGVYDVGGRLGESLTTLPEILSANGFVTGGFAGNPVVDRLKSDPTRTAGFEQGFDVFKGMRALPEVPEGAEPNDVPRELCAPLVGEALKFVEANKDDRFFLWMLLFDPHAPYAPPAPYDTLYVDHPELRAASVKLDREQIHHQAYVSDRLDSHEYIARHMGEVTMTDYRLGALLRRLDALPGRTLLVITADHGESLGDADYWFGHGSNIRHPCVNVPLIIACDGVVPAGVSDSLVANIDLAPTILDLLGLPAEELVANGLPLARTFSESDPWPGRMIPLQAYEGRRWRGVRSARFCLQSQFDGQSGERLRSLLYDLRSDPKERSDVSGARPGVLQELLEHEDLWFSQGYRPPDDELRRHPEMIRRLKSLGYLQ